MAISTWISDKAAGASQVLQGRDLVKLGLETVLSCSAIDPGTNLGGVAENDLKDHLSTFHAAVDTAIGDALSAEMSYKGGFSADAANGNALFPSKIGDMYTVDAAGNAGGFFTTSLEVGDVIIAEVVRANQAASTVADWTVLEQNLSAVQSQITANDGDITDIRSALGINDGAANVGNFNAGIISAGGTVKAGMQELETDAAALQLAVGIAAEAANLGSFNGTTISNTGSVKAGMQELETKAELNATNVTSNDSELAALHARFPVAEKGRLHFEGESYRLDFTDADKPQLLMTVISASSEVDLVCSLKS